jgi:toxin-antitoxin system PIN domain toxin
VSGYLLDVNVLIAILSKKDPRHPAAMRWFEESGHQSWYTCPIVENGTLRILTNPQASKNPISFAQAAEMLESLFPLGKHRFIPENISLLDSRLIDRSVNITHKQSTDVYLLALAVHHEATFATFDRNVASRAVIDGDEHLLVLR